MASITISGTVYQSDGTTAMGSGRTINVSVNGAASAASATTASDGTYTTGSFTSNSGDVLTIYLQGNTELGCVVTKGAAANLTGINITQDALRLRSDNGVSLTQTNLNTSDNNGATGISGIYAAASNTSLILVSGKQLIVDSGQSFTVATSGVVTSGAAITVNGTIVGGVLANVTTVGNFTNNGTYTRGTGETLKLSGTSSHTIKSNGSTLPIVSLLGVGGTYTLADDLTASGSVTISVAATLDVSASNFAINCGGWNNSAGTFVARSGTVTLNNATANIRSNGNSFYNLAFGTSASTLTLADGLVVSNNLTIGANKTLDVSASNFGITVGGNWSNSGTLNPRSGTVTLNGAGGTTQTISGSTTFYNLTATAAAARAITFTDGTTQTVTNSLTLTGSVGQLLTLQGSSTGGWTLAVPSTQSISYVSVSRSTATGNTASAGSTSTDGGNNVNWTFGSAATIAPTGNPGLKSGLSGIRSQLGGL